MTTTINQDRQFGSDPFDPRALARIHGARERRLTRRGKAVGLVVALALGLPTIHGVVDWAHSRSVANAPLRIEPGEPILEVPVGVGDNPTSVTARIASNNGSHNPDKMLAYIATFEMIDSVTHQLVLQPGQIPVPADRYHLIYPSPNQSNGS